MKVLLIDDDPTTSQTIKLTLGNANLRVHMTDTGEEGVELARFYDYDLIVLELDLPDITGFEVLRRMRNARIETPILVLTDIGDTERTLKSFKLGADDYMTKPFNREELAARSQAIIRRYQGNAKATIHIGMIDVNLDSRTAEVGGKPVHLTTKEFQMLELLALRKGRTRTKQEFMDHLYGGMDEPELRIIDVFMCKLRRKLKNATGGENYIDTVWGQGYVLNEPDHPETEKQTIPSAA